ncbi:WG repeat-containing protein [Paenibacillus cremeus]|uniref:DUF3298 domain-containing protein n=1 Tax=Paenibacillus cremeus TaxID=2163881 RepID=A0A559KFI6_9BACL|nr:WG repeat-containing protein [Paenibacillus cremeus]TVY10885.1 DUF3298 domain-containing protein [Paenibacillus cremeus]
MANEEQIVQLILAHLPYGGQLEPLHQSNREYAAICAADLDGDGVQELSAVYRLGENLRFFVLKYHGYGWAPVFDGEAPPDSVNIHVLTAAPVVTGGRSSLIAGWQQGSLSSRLSVYDLTMEGFRDVAPEELMPFSYLEVMHATERRGDESQAELALWRQESPGTYRVEVLQWRDGSFRSAGAVHPLFSPLAHRVVEAFPASVKTTNGVEWGYINNKGMLTIHPQYEYAFDFQENGLAVVVAHGRNGLINSAGRYAVQPIYESINPFSEGRAVVSDHEGFKLMDEAGRIVTRKAYSYISSMHDGRAMFNVQGTGGKSLYGYLDAQGREVIPAQFEEAADFNHEKAVVKIKDRDYALIGPDGQRLASYPYASVGPLSDGRLSFQQEPNGKYGYIDEQGKIVIQPAYVFALPFQEGRAVVNTSDGFKAQYGVIDALGKTIVKPEYNDIRQLGEKRLAIGKAINEEQPWMGSMFAIADLDGKLLTDFKYHDVSEYKKGLASASDQRQTFFIDLSGQPAPGYPRVNGNGTLTLQDSLIQANVDMRQSYLTRNGAIVWQQNTVIPLNAQYRVKEDKYKPNKDYLVYFPQVEGMRDLAAQQRVNSRLKELSQVKPIPGNVQLSYSYNGDFEVSFFKKELLVLQMTGYNFPFGAAHGMPSKVYAHVDLVDGRFYELKDLFKPGSNYVAVLSEIVGKQIKTDPQYSYVFPDTYKGIKPDQPFYVTEHALHLYFAPYDIAPYAAGFPTFTIPFTEIMNMIAVDGGFWKSFHG